MYTRQELIDKLTPILENDYPISSEYVILDE